MSSLRRLTKTKNKTKTVKKWPGRQGQDGVTAAKGEVMINLAKVSDLFCSKKISRRTDMIRVPAGKSFVNGSCSREGDVVSILCFHAAANHSNSSPV